ncbi:uncharacterized protein LOC127877467 isoform X6 [Dreissena polymorpha]|uniref:uncharacterized protein LOC127877467 isoform X6 n=1 Tax=Dreissena polymorpha TaxID=45954 RepID=UPI0022642F76|nr:uncharacterized protein LOC127877467 isoform X6 [Dreissena polymorpha]
MSLKPFKSDLEEIKVSTLKIKKRLDELSQRTPKCQCGDRISQVRTDIQNLGSRLDRFASTHDKGVNTHEHRFQRIQQQIVELNDLILSCQSNEGVLEDVHKASTTGTQSVESDNTNVSQSDREGSTGNSTENRSSSTGAAFSPAQNNSSANRPFSGENSISEYTTTRESLNPERFDTQGTRRKTKRVTFAEPDTEWQTIRQTTKSYMDMDIWRTLAQSTLNSALQTTSDIECIVTVLLLDISESMATGEAWKQTKTFVKDFLKGLNEIRSIGDEQLKDEYVAVATFGHETRLQMLLSSNYDSVQEIVDRLTPGGPSPLYGGLWMGLAGAMSCKKARFTSNGVTILPKIIILSDYRPTETLLTQGPDVPDWEKTDETLANVMSALGDLDRRGMTVFVVPVGDYDQEFVNVIKPAGRRLYNHTEGRRLARRHYLSVKTDLLVLTPIYDGMFSSEDLDDMLEIRVESLNLRLRTRQVDPENMYKESASKIFPQIGSRVRRGPDWHSKNQDHGEPGTVVGHDEEDSLIWVTWDADDNTNVYHYGGGGYEVLVYDEPRTLKPGEKIAVGCWVKPGKDGKFQKIHEWNKGVVIRVQPPKAHVRWDSGARGDYSYGEDGKCEIELCATHPQLERTDLVSTVNNAALKLRKKNKNM